MKRCSARVAAKLIMEMSGHSKCCDFVLNLQDKDGVVAELERLGCEVEQVPFTSDQVRVKFPVPAAP